MKSCAASLSLSPVTMLNGRATLYVSSATFSAVASAPSIFTAFTVSFREPRDTYPIEFSSPATVVSITSVLFVMLASCVVISTFSPSFSSSIPNSSTNAPRVPDPSSREITSIAPDGAAITTVPITVVPISAAVKTPAILFFMIFSPHFYDHFYLLTA